MSYANEGDSDSYSDNAPSPSSYPQQQQQQPTSSTRISSRQPSSHSNSPHPTHGGKGLPSRNVTDDEDDDDEEEEGIGGATPGAATGDDDEEEPQELDSDLDPINSGVVTPAAVPAAVPTLEKKNKALNFLKKKETKTIKGQTYTILNDELMLEDDPRGEAKIDPDGNLLGDREWKLHTFTSPMRTNPNKLYMLSIDAARAAGFRDSLYFFRRNPLIHKLSCTQTEKDRLIELGKLSGNLKSRAVTMVSARNCFKVMGAVFVRHGKYVFDDYYEDKALAAGHQPGEPAWIEGYDPDKDSGTLASSKGPIPAGVLGSGLNHLLNHAGKPKDGRPGDQYITSTIGGGVNAVFGGTGLQPFGKTWDPAAKKGRPASHLTVENWMLEYAKSVKESDLVLGRVRKLNVGQVQVGVGVEEKEEDCWDEVEEEYEEVVEVPLVDEGELGERERERREVSAAAAMMAMDVDSRPSQQPQPLTSTSGLDALASTALYALDPSHQHQQQQNIPHNPLLALANASATFAAANNGSPSPAPQTISGSSTPLPNPPPQDQLSRANSLIPQPPPPTTTTTTIKRKRTIKVYNPIRGFYDPETNVPHVFNSTQPRVCRIEKAGVNPVLFDEVQEGEEEEEEERKKRRRIEEKAGRMGVATVDYVVDNRKEGGREGLIPGMWDFGAGLV